MTLPARLQSVRARPGMYLNPVTPETVVAFINGYDEAMSCGLLVGFREWLVARVGYGNNLVWHALVDELRKSVYAEVDPGVNGSVQDHVGFIFATLEEFLTARNQTDGLRRIFLAHEAWLRKQDWYGPESPDWMPID